MRPRHCSGAGALSTPCPPETERREVTVQQGLWALVVPCETEVWAPPSPTREQVGQRLRRDSRVATATVPQTLRPRTAQKLLPNDPPKRSCGKTACLASRAANIRIHVWEVEFLRKHSRSASTRAARRTQQAPWGAPAVPWNRLQAHPTHEKERRKQEPSRHCCLTFDPTSCRVLSGIVP